MNKNDFKILIEKLKQIYKDNFKDITKNDSEEQIIFRENAYNKLIDYKITQKIIEKYRDSNIIEILCKDRVLNLLKGESFNQEYVCSVSNLDTLKYFNINGEFHNSDIVVENFEITNISNNFNENIDLFNQSEYDFIKLINDIFFQSGFCINIKENSTISKCIQITMNTVSENDLFVNNKNLIVLNENSELNIVICNHTQGDKNYLTNSITEIFLKKHSRINILEIQSEAIFASKINSVFITQEQGSVVSHKIITLSGSFVRNNIQINLNGEHAENEISGLYLTDHKQKVNNHIDVNHNISNCQSNQLFKGVLDEYSEAIFAGTIYVKKDAQKTLAFQSNKNILLSESAKVTSKPQLEIYADDVKCSHGATIGQIDQEAIYYLKARGITEEEAMQMLKFAFLNEIIQKIKIELIRKSVTNLVKQRLAGECILCDQHC